MNTRGVKRKIRTIMGRMDDKNITRLYFAAAGMLMGKQGNTGEEEAKRLAIIRTVAGVEGMETLDAISGALSGLLAGAKQGSILDDCIGIRAKVEGVRGLMESFKDCHTDVIGAIFDKTAGQLLQNSTEMLGSIISLMEICRDSVDAAIASESARQAGTTQQKEVKNYG